MKRTTLKKYDLIIKQKTGIGKTFYLNTYNFFRIQKISIKYDKNRQGWTCKCRKGKEKVRKKSKNMRTRKSERSEKFVTFCKLCQYKRNLTMLDIYADHFKPQ